MRLENKTAVIVGAGQSLGETVGNGRATALLFAREGAKVMAVDRDLDSAEETAVQVRAEGGEAIAVQADVTDEASLEAAINQCKTTWGTLDILHNNVGISVAGGDAEVTDITVEAFDLIMAVNIRSVVLACKYAVPIMREQGSGSIINISSLAAIEKYPWVAYKISKSGMIAFTEQLAYQNAPYGVRANSILPGLMDTPMAVDTRAYAWGKTREEVAAARDARVPLRGKMGTAWDVAYAALYLASDEANFVTGVALRVDGGAGVNVG
jgi:NAD(P)-dependent dehydrogenase (short-subunit alcohol dehydrogenase family)